MVYETRADASSRMSADQISDVALSLEYVKQYGEAHKELNYKQACLLEQCVARRSYNLYSDVQKGENVVVEIPVQAGEKKFKYEQKDLDNHAYQAGSETSSNVVDALDSVDELETDLVKCYNKVVTEVANKI